MNYYRRFIGDYLKKTAGLSLLEHGAYSLLLDYYYADEKPIPAETQQVYRLVRALVQEEQKAVDRVLGMYFDLREDGYHNIKADEELGIARKVIDTAKENGKKGGRPRTDKQTGEKPSGIPGGLPAHKPAGEPANNHPPASNHQPSTNTLLRKVGETGVPPCPHLEIIEAYHRLLPMGRRVNAELWNGTRASHLKARWRENPKRQTLDFWERFFAYIAESKFLTGKIPPPPGRTPFELSLDWIVNPTNFAKIHEGAYNK